MNQRKFLNELNSKTNEHGDFTYSIVSDLIDSQYMMVNSEETFKLKNTIKRIFSSLRREKSAKQIVEDNFGDVLRKTKNSYVDLLVIKLIEDSNTQQIVTKNLDIIFNKLTTDDVFEYCNADVFESIKELPGAKNYIEKK